MIRQLRHLRELRKSAWKGAVTGNMTDITEQYCEALLLADRPEEAKRISEKGLQINPENDWLIIYQGSSNVMLGDTIAAEKSISEIRSM